MKANLTRPRTGLVAQVNLLNELACRERLESEERWALLVKKWREKSESTKKEGGGDGDKTGKTDEKAEADERADQPRWATVKIDGKEVAVCLAASRWTRFKTDLTEPGGIGDIASLGLSRVLRCDSPAEREKMLTEAAARVEEWGAALRREETAARIFCESWRFDAASQRRRALLTLAFKENRTMLLTFAGRASWPGGAAESDKTLDETKRRFNFLWNEAQMVENELVAIVERLRERLQDERARSFIAFAEENGGVAVGAWLWSVEADKAVFASLCRMTSQIASRNAEVARNVENNWFGIAAERLEKTDVTSWRIESPLTDRSSETAVAAEGDEDAGARCRFSALAALLTFGVDENETRQMKTQLNEIEEVALFDGGSDRLGESGTEANETAKDDEPNAEIDATSSKEAGGKAGDSSEESKTLDGVVSSENIEGWETRNEELSGATVGETGNQEGANSDGGAWNERGKQDKQKQETIGGKAFSGELPDEARRRFEGTKTPEILPEYEEKIRRYRRRILDERR